MARGRPRKEGALRPDQRKPGKVLEIQENPVIPPMPDPADWVGMPQDAEDEPVEWSSPVVSWWNDIWSSPMAAEFTNSDIHGLYLACYYLHEGLNPYYKLTDRIKSMGAFENTIKKFGLTPADRESLRWQISQGESAQNRTNQLRAQQKAETRKNAPADNVTDLYNRFG